MALVGAAPLPRSWPPGEAGSPAHRRAGLVDVSGSRPALAARHPLRHQAQRDRQAPSRLLPAWALMRRALARDLGRVQRRLRRRGLEPGDLRRLPPRPRDSRALVRWAQRNGRGTSWAPTSPAAATTTSAAPWTSRWCARRDGKRIRMGPYDDLGPAANTCNARGRVLRNRLILVRAMERFGFVNYTASGGTSTIATAARAIWIWPSAAGAETAKRGCNWTMSTRPEPLRVALAQINPTVGDIEGNAAKIARASRRARDEGAALVVFPELAPHGLPAGGPAAEDALPRRRRRRARGAGRRGPAASSRWWASPSARTTCTTPPPCSPTAGWPPSTASAPAQLRRRSTSTATSRPAPSPR